MFTAMLTRLRGLLQRRRVARELDDELAFHLEMEIQANRARGLSPAEARLAALREFGGVDQAREAVRDVRTVWIEAVWQDLRHAARQLRSRPGVGLAAVAMLALAVGITTTMFTIADALLLRPAPFREAGELAFVFMGSDHGGQTTVSPAVLRAWRESRAFAAVESAASGTALVEAGDTVVARGMAVVTPGLFDMLGGVRPVRGRLFEPPEGRPGHDDRVLLSEDVWRGLYHADPSLVGQRVSIDGERLLVVGILPSEFRFPSWDSVIWKPVDFNALPRPGAGARATAYVRFAPDLPREDALRLAADAARGADAGNAKLRPWVQPLAGLVLDKGAERAVPLLVGGVVLVFLVLCANVTSLLLARMTARRREFGMRSALGASRARLLGQALVESGLIGALGIAGGIGLTWALVSAARAVIPEAVLGRTLNLLNVDPRALVVASLAGAAATLAAGLLPAWVGTRVDARSSMGVAEPTSTETRGARAMTRALLVGEIALACMLLVGATLLVRSFINLAETDRGLETSGVITATLSLPQAAFPGEAARAAAARSLDEAVRQLPGVQRIAWSYGLPPDGGAISFGEWRSDAPGSPVVNAIVERYQVGADFFELYGIRLLGGRTFLPSDNPGDVVVGERLAGALWPGLDPLGRSFGFLREQFRVIGVAREIHHPSLDPMVDRPEFYEVFSGVGSYAMMSLRCGGRCPDLALLRHRVGAAVPSVRLAEVRRLDDVYAEQLAHPRATAALGFVFAAIALLATAGGLFSVLTYSVGRRRREFGIRTALGASPGTLRRLVLRDGLTVGLTGLAIGAAAAWPLARALASMQYGVTISDPLTWSVVLAVLVMTILLTSWRPARQAMRVDPVRLLREE